MSAEEPVPFDEKSFSIFRYRPVMLMWFARVTTALAYQMQAVAVGWQIYDLTSSPFLLGMVGLMMFIPGVVLVLVVGQVSDRFDRSMVIRIAQAVEAAAVVAVGDMADQKPEHHHREELHEADEAEVEGAAGQFVDLPADRDRLHLIGAVGRGPRAPIGHVRTVFEQRGWRGGNAIDGCRHGRAPS